MVRINRLFFPLVEKEKGRFIDFSSEYGTYLVVPFNAFHITNKHAEESYSNDLRRVLKYIGIAVVTISSDAFKTEIVNSTSTIFNAITEKKHTTKAYCRKFDKFIKVKQRMQKTL